MMLVALLYECVSRGSSFLRRLILLDIDHDKERACTS